MTLQLRPITYQIACNFVTVHHRHHRPPQGHKYSIGVSNGEKLCGVIIVGRPVARGLDNGFTLEVTRCATDGTKNAASMLYGAAWRAAKAMGYRRLITYIRYDEPGTSLIAAGWEKKYELSGRSWNTPSRNRTDKTEIVQRSLWEATS